MINKIDELITQYKDQKEIRYDSLKDNEKYKKAVLEYWTKVKDINENYSL